MDIKENKKIKIPIFLYLFWALLLIVAIIFTLSNPKEVKHQYYDKMIEASTKTLNCYNEIKQYKIDNSISLPKEDIFNSGMIGLSYSSITTTSGDLKAKRTATNPNFAALFIKYFYDLGLRKGDELALSFSGSFPTLNLACIVAVETYGLKPIVMSTIGASSYGANDPNLTFFDMHKLLYDKGLIHTKLDYVSFGGSYDDGREFEEEFRESLINRINNSDSTFYSEPDYEKNISDRLNFINKKCPNVKLLVNVGGNLISMGEDDQHVVYYRGIVTPSKAHKYTISKAKIGLIKSFLDNNKPIIQMLNIKGICLDNDIIYNPSQAVDVGIGNMYYRTSYSLFVPIISLTLSLILLLFILFYTKIYHKKRR